MTSNTLHLQIALCGRGGQGILFLTRIFDEVALARGLQVISSETHGMAMRGGSVTSFIRIGDFHSPLISRGQADILMVLSESELRTNRYLAKKTGAQIYVNTPRARKRSLDADRIALRLGSLIVSNLVLLGFAAAHPEFPFVYQEFLYIIEKISPQRVRESNIKAFMEGYSVFSQNQ